MAKQKPSSSLDLSAWIDQRQSQGLYHFNREDTKEMVKGAPFE